MFISHLVKDKYLRIVLAATVALHSIVSVIVLAKFLPRRESIILHFDTYRGIDFVGGRMDLFGIVLSAYVMFALNFALADFLYTRDRFFSYVLSFGSLLLAVLFTAALLIVYSVN